MPNDKTLRDRDECPNCGKMMCEHMSESVGPHGIFLATPSGKYWCNWCGYDELKEREREGGGGE